MFKIAFITLLIASVSFSKVADNDKVLYNKFTDFLHKYQKVYKTEAELENRFQIFKQNFIENAYGEKASSGLNEFFDWTKDEVEAGYIGESRKCKTTTELPPFDSNRVLPDTLDWRTKGKVSPIKNQSQVDTSFAFSAVSYLESQALIKFNKNRNFSEKQILDCDNDSSRLMEGAMLYVQQYGIESEYEYGHKETPDQCKYDSSKVINRVKNVVCTENASVNQIKQFLNDVGPIAIGISSMDLQIYLGGIAKCKHNDVMDLGVLLIGYGVDHWIIKSQWGTAWGEGGFAKISIKAGENCGIGQYVVYADLV